MNLIDDAWIPVRCADGTEKHIAPYQITEVHAENPVVQLAAPRPDFNGALAQFLIGLLQTACPPKGHNEWAGWLDAPPEPEQLHQVFSRYHDAFNLDGDGPRSMQDLRLGEEIDQESDKTYLERQKKHEGKKRKGMPPSKEDIKTKTTGKYSNGIGDMLIDAPTGKTLEDNKDHFIKRGGVLAMCPSCAATALFTLQINAPSGGQGHRTSLRGGGPLTTLVVYDPKGNEIRQHSLWQTLWLNVLAQPQIKSLTGNQKRSDLKDIFPWLAPTRTSENKTGTSTCPQDAHPLQMYWGMPRRIRLDWEHVRDGNCDLCMQKSCDLVSSYISKNHGVNYEGAWQFPLSPYREAKDNKSPTAEHAQPGGISYRLWAGIAFGNNTVKPAKVISYFHEQRKEKWEQMRIWAFGYDIVGGQNKARCWYETTVPLYLMDESRRSVFSERVQAMVEAGTLVSRYVQICIAGIWMNLAKESWFGHLDDDWEKHSKKFTMKNQEKVGFLPDAFFHNTESAFYDMLEELRQHLLQQQDHLPLLEKWHHVITHEALNLFDQWAGVGDIAFENPRLLATARNKLNNLLYSKRIRELLQLPDKRRKAA